MRVHPGLAHIPQKLEGLPRLPGTSPGLPILPKP
jgi:hypothetical protein